MSILENINGPEDLRDLNVEQLINLSGELREKLINTVAKTGGHLAPSLGVVELTLGVHYCFNSPQDKIIWDVGHQAYVHKILTGRKDEFETLRQYKGLSGFPKIKESEHDAFSTGHSSTSISAGLGMALARDQLRKEFEVVSIIGDGALTGGMAFEALNYAGHLGVDLKVIVNDNEMSISNNVGAMSSYLTRIRTDPMYYKGKEELETLLKRLPAIGSRVVKVADRIKDSFKYLVVPGMIFEELGFTHLGPIDGHNISSVISVLKRAKSTKGPVLIHVITKKGKGYQPAEENPDKFHGISPFNVENGKSLKKRSKYTYTEVFGNTITRLANNIDNLVAITAAMPSGTGLNIFREKFPKRFYDVGIAEQNAVTTAAGMATQGLKPVVAIYSTFLQRAYDQIIHDVCMQNLPVIFAIDRAGIVGADGETHQGLFDITFLRSIPNMTLLAPKDENELQHMLYTACHYEEGPIAVRYPRGEGIGVPLDSQLEMVPKGKAEIMKEGNQVTLLACGPIVYTALEAADELQKEGIEAAVINARYLKPLDEELILSFAKNTKCLVTVEEHLLAGGFGSSVLELLSQKGIDDVIVRSVGINDVFVEHGKPDQLREEHGITMENIIKKTKEALNSKKILSNG
ncbi:MAG: 1-deoxy-D-xylulose-5-phosphate synthase [Clostridia bacterium]|nr:1-deoxy-D-xylulose-5-phosphate synthase [Clostridia bacterium]